MKNLDSLQYTVRRTTQEEINNNMPYVTASMIEAVNTCPRWGIIHNVLNKTFTSNYRQMALEAGSLMHDVFACLNLFQVGYVQNLQDHMHHKGTELFTKQRWEYLHSELVKKDANPTKDSTVALERFLLSVIASSDFYDDPGDRNRTVSNLEHCTYELLQYWQSNFADANIFIEDKDNPTAPIGIEISLDCVFEVDKRYTIRCIGLADAVFDINGTPILGEYKTASSMNDAWRLAFDTRHQITLYSSMLRAYYNTYNELDTLLIGSAIPARTTSMPVQHFTIHRDEQNIKQMLNTFIFTNGIIETFCDEPLQTPMFTHSCNRYFRPCSFLDLCTAEVSDQEIILEQMETKELSPSEQKALLRNM
jgi:hypothetical protein